MDCPNCKTENPSAARFCMSCGSSLANVCPECGTELPAEARFCMGCGHQLAQTEIAATATESSRANLGALHPSRAAEQTGGRPEGRKLSGENGVSSPCFSATLAGRPPPPKSSTPKNGLEIMNGAFENLIAPVYRYEGTLARLMGRRHPGIFRRSHRP